MAICLDLLGKCTINQVHFTQSPPLLLLLKRAAIFHHYFRHPGWPLQDDAVNFLVTRYDIRLFDSLLWYEKGQNTATKKLLAIIMKVEVFLACVLHMFVILNGSENLLFFLSMKNLNFIFVLIGMSTFIKLSPVDALGSYHLVPGIGILEMRLKRSQKLDFRTSNCTK